MEFLKDVNVATWINKELYTSFMEKKKELRKQNIKYDFYFASSSKTIRLMIEVFTKLNSDFLKLVDKLEEGK